MLSTLALVVVFQQQQLAAEQIYEATTPSILTLTVDRPHGTTAIGTAFLAIKKNVAVTAWHVVKGAKRIVAKFSDGSEAIVKGVIDKNIELDIALVELESGARPGLSIATAEPKVGSRAYVIGSPKGMDFSISDGIISQTPLMAQGKLYQFTCPVSAGNSGGPLLNSAGQVMGVVSWQLRDAQNLNFAIPVTFVDKLDCQKASTPLGTPFEDNVAQSPVLRTIDDEALLDIIKRSELTASSRDDGTGTTAYLIESSGTKLTLFQYGSGEKKSPTENLSLSAGFSDNLKADLAKVNSFNRGHRFARSYRDSDGTLYLENDLDISSGIGIGNIVNFLTDFSATLHEFETEILPSYKRASDARLTFGKVIEPEELISRIDDTQIRQVLNSAAKSVKAEDDGTGKTRFSFEVDGLWVSLYQFTDDDPKGPTTSFTLSAQFQSDGFSNLESINEFNRATRYCKAFLDDKEVFVVADLDLHGGVTTDTINTFITRFIKTAHSFGRPKLALGE